MISQDTAVLISVHLHCYFDVHLHIRNSDGCVAGNDVRDIPTMFRQCLRAIISLTVTFQLVHWLLTSGYFSCGRCCDWWISSLGYMSSWRRINRFHMDQGTHLQAGFMSPVAPLWKQLTHCKACFVASSHLFVCSFQATIFSLLMLLSNLY